MILLILGVFFGNKQQGRENYDAEFTRKGEKLGKIENCALHNHNHNIISIDY